MISPSQENKYSVRNRPLSGRAPGRNFFGVMAWVFCAIAVAGFAPSYQAAYHGTARFHWFVHVHGAIMAAWFGVFLIQTMLVKNRALRLHRQMGLYSVGLGILVWLSMGVVSYRVLIGYPAHVHRLNEIVWELAWVQLSAMNLFGVFFAWAILRRNNPALHKRLLYLSMVVLLQAALGRMSWLPWTGADHPLTFFMYLDLLLVPLVGYDLATLKSIHKITLIGSESMIAAQLIILMF
jgi:hypothetical protein